MVALWQYERAGQCVHWRTHSPPCRSSPLPHAGTGDRTGFRPLAAASGARREERQLRQEVEEILALFGERLLPRLNEPAYSLSYANCRRIEIAWAFALRPRLLLLDEPTAGMNPTETEEMLEFIHTLKQRGLTILLIEHKLSLVMQLSDRVVAMDNGQKIAEGAPETVRNDPGVSLRHTWGISSTHPMPARMPALPVASLPAPLPQKALPDEQHPIATPVAIAGHQYLLRLGAGSFWLECGSAAEIVVLAGAAMPAAKVRR